MGVRQYADYANVITASGYALGMHRGMHLGTNQVIALSVKLGETGFGACTWREPYDPGEPDRGLAVLLAIRSRFARWVFQWREQDVP